MSDAQYYLLNPVDRICLVRSNEAKKAKENAKQSANARKCMDMLVT